MNFADMATERWSSHLFAKARITSRGADNKDKATRYVDRDIASGNRGDVSAAKREILIALETRRINDNDILRKNLIDESTFAREEMLCLVELAKLHGHTPTRRITPS